MVTWIADTLPSDGRGKSFPQTPWVRTAHQNKKSRSIMAGFVHFGGAEGGSHALACSLHGGEIIQVVTAEEPIIFRNRD